MKTILKRPMALLLSLCLLLCLPAPALADETAGGTTLSVTLERTYLTLSKGDTDTLTATASDSSVDFAWTSSDTNVATVAWNTNTATVTAVGAGTATITVTAAKDSMTATSKCEVTVTATSVSGVTICKDGSTPLDSGTPETLKLLPDGDATATGDTIELTAVCSPAAVDGTVTYTWTAYRTGSVGISSGDSVSLQGSGKTVKVQAVAAGSSVVQVTVRNTLPDGSVVIKGAQCVVTVDPLALNKLEVKCGDNVVASSDTSVTTTELEAMDVGDSLILTPVFDPSNATDKTVTWTSSNTNVVQVTGDANGCTVLARGDGTATITAQAGGKTAKCTVTVKPREIKNIQIATPAPTLLVGGSQQLAYLITYSDGTISTTGNVEWSCDKTDIVGLSPVTGGCTVTAKAVGTAVVTVRVETTAATSSTVEENGKYYLSGAVTVTVTDTPVSSIILDPNSLTYVDVGGTLRFLASLLPSNATGTVQWSSSDSSVASVGAQTGADGTANDKVGVLTGVKPGTATVTARVQSPAGAVTDESGNKWAEATCNVEVSGIELDQDAIALAVGESAQVGVRKAYGDAKSAVETDREWSLEKDADAAYVNVDPSNGLITAKAECSGVVVICSQGGYTAKLTVTVSNSSATQVTCTMRSGEALCFQDILSKFGSPEYLTGLSVSGSEGTLYYGYVSANDPGSGVSSSDRFYRLSSSTDVSRKLLSNVTFVPASGFVGDAIVSYTTSDGKTGSLAITVLDPTKISYVSDNGEAVYFRADDFINYAKAKYGYSVSSVRFTPPDARYGWLYANYSGGEVYGSNITSDRRFYASSTPSIDTVAFIPKEGYTGTFTIKYDGVDTSGRSFTGDIEIAVGSAGEGAGDIAYTAYVNDRLYFTPADFQELCTAAGKGTLSYVQFTALPEAEFGKLLYGSSSTAVTTAGRYYYASSGGNFLGNVNFLPTAIGSVTIPFTASASGGVVTGSVTISILDSSGRASTVYYTSDGMPAGFTRGDFADACGDALAGDLASVTFTLPSSAYGTLYERFQDLHTNTPLAAGKEIAAADLIGVTFVPKGGTEGSIYIDYTAKDAKGNSCSGSVRVYVEPNTASQYFKDMGKHGWAASSVDFLRRYGVVTGYSDATYHPASPISRGDFTLMLYRAFDLPDNGNRSFSDVPTDSYYATAIAAAKAKNIAQGSDGRFRPADSISRQDAAVLLYRALQTRGSVPAAQSYSLSRFSDGGQVADYAQEAMAAMVELGVFKGDNGLLKPAGTLTRAEMAVILHRAIT